MITKVIVPELGLDMEEATVGRWLVSQGDFVARGDILLELETDKVTLEQEAKEAGMILKICIAEGGVVPVGAVLAYIGESGDSIPGGDQHPATAAPDQSVHRGKPMPTDLDQQIAELVPSIAHEHEKQLLLELLQALKASQDASKFLEPIGNSPEQALPLLEMAVDLNLPSWVAWHRHGLTLMRLGQYEEAISSYHKSLAFNQVNDDTDGWHSSYHNLIDCYVKTEKFSDGWDFLSQLLLGKTDWWLVWHHRGYMGKSRDKSFSKATIDSYLEAIKRHHDDLGWIWSSEDLKNYFFDHSALEEGHETFLKLTKDYEEYWILWHDRGWFELQLNKLSNAKESYLKAIDKQRNGGWFWSWNDLGEIYAQLNHHIEASEAFGQAIEQAPVASYGVGEKSNLWHAWKRKGDALKNFGQYSDAIDAYQEATKCGEDLDELYFSLGYCQEKSQQLCLAFGSYCEAVTRSHQEAKLARENLLDDLQVRLWEFLNHTFDLNELKTLCFTLPGVDFDNLGGERKSDKMRELITLQLRRDRKSYQPLRKMIAVIQKMRPDMPLP